MWQLFCNVSKYSILHFDELDPNQFYIFSRTQISSKHCEKDLNVAISTVLKLSTNETAAVKKLLDLLWVW